MPLDHYKTQVLLLHAEQSTLDSLGAGFPDRYAVHFATSGSEALTTLVETPINVIISAQDLPGMSGLEALREAKKRSPETVGILLAGSTNEDLEALVGDEEVFQIVRGNVTSESLRKMVDNATQQVRLMALAESANDTAADVDEPAEHIVMETSENGATIISDGTDRIPALNPAAVSAAAAAGSRFVDVLVFTKDQEFLATIKESSCGMHTVHYANTLAQADELIRKHKVGVAVLDAAMVTEKIERLIQYLRDGSSRLVPIVAGRRDDGEMLLDLINRGKVYRFLLKPVSPGRARLAVEASVKHHLEAPDAAFRNKGAPAARRVAQKPAAKPGARPAPATATQASPVSKPLVAKQKVSPAASPVEPPLGSPRNGPPIDDRLSSAFGKKVSSFAETVTGLVGLLTKKRDKVETTAPVVAANPAHASKSAALSDGFGGSIVKNLKIIGIAAATLIILASVLFWFGSNDDAVEAVDGSAIESAPSAAEEDVVINEPVNAGSDIQQFVDEARLARGAGQIFNPAGSNAIELFLAAAAADSSNAAVAAELDAVIEQALGMAETAVLETRLDDASAALERVAMADADNPRLPFLAAQLSQLRLRGHLADARAAIRDTRFEDAGNAIAAARALGVGDANEINSLADELNAARSEQRVDEVLALANARFEEGDLLSPANDNARYYYDLVLSNDPGNTAARQGLTVIASKLVLQARTEIDAGRLDNAERLLNDARAIDAASSELAATDTALDNARAAIILEEQRREEADRQAAENARLEEERLAEQKAQAAAAVEQAPAETVAEPVAADADEAIVDAATSEGGASTTDAAAAETMKEPVIADVTTDNPVAISTLTRTKYAAPKYPRVAQRRNLSGWVDIVFTVRLDGSVEDVEVRDADPADVFDNAAIRAVQKWEFEPVIENGVTVQKRAGVRMMFALE